MQCQKDLISEEFHSLECEFRAFTQQYRVMLSGEKAREERAPIYNSVE